MDNFERVSDPVIRRLESRRAFQTLSECCRFLIWTRLTSHLNAFGFWFECAWLFVRTRLASCSNAFGFLFECVSYNDWTRPGWGANTFGQKRVPDGYCTWCSSIDRLDNFRLFIDRQHYFSSFKLLRHSSHFAKALFNQQRDFCACAIKPRLCWDNRGFIYLKATIFSGYLI